MRNFEREQTSARRVLALAICVAGLILAGAVSTRYLSRNVVDLLEKSELESGSDDASGTPRRILSMRLAKSQESSAETARANSKEQPVVVAAARRRGVTPVSDRAVGKPRAIPSVAHKASTPTYRTVCVRECDGGYFPISFSTTREHFARDAQACTSRCGVPARLFVYPLGVGSPATMVDLDGRPYSSLANADRFRTERRPACSCSPEAWQQEALNRHRIYELSRRADKQPLEAKELALRSAIEEVRRLRPGGLAALTVGVGIPAADPRGSGLLPGDGQPVIGGRESETERPEIVVRYAGELKPVSVVYDATGRPVPVKAQSKTAPPPTVSVIARVVEPAAAPADIATASISPEPGAHEAQVNKSLTVAADENSEAKLSEGQRLAIASTSAKAVTPSSRRKSQSSIALQRRPTPALPAGRGNLTASVASWYGNRIYSGGDWRLSNYQALE